MPHQQSHDIDRERRLDEAIAEYLEAVDAGRRPDPAEWLTRFPDLAPDLASFFGDQEQVRGLLYAAGPTPGPEVTVTGQDMRPLVALNLPHFGDYELQEEIARGGMGVVYRARQ